MKTRIKETLNAVLDKGMVFNILRVTISVCLIAMTVLIRTRQDLFVYENGYMGSMSPELMAILFIGMILDWKKIYHVILALVLLSSLFHFVFIGIADHLTGKLIIMVIEIITIISLVAIIRVRERRIADV